MEPEKQTEETNSTESMVTPTEVGQTNGVEDKNGQDHKVFAVLGYIIPFIFFIPLLDEKTKNVPFVRFHANQQILILVIYLAIQFLSGMIYSALGGLTFLVMNVVNLALLALVVYGAWHAYKGEMKKLPFVGDFKILS